MVLWAIAILGLGVALIALALARRLARRLETLNQAYWELRYDYTRLRSRVSRLDPEEPEGEAVEPSAMAPAPPSVSFVPLSSLKRKE